MKYKHIHFVGIKGVGMTALAVVVKEAGMHVTGSDIEKDFITAHALADAGIKPLVGFSPSHIQGADLVITTGAHGGYENPEVIAAKQNKVPVFSHGQALGMVASGELLGKVFKTIAVAGTHGKTTTAAMIATFLSALRLDPGYVIGTGNIPSLSGPGHFGSGKFFVAEADEYATEPMHDKKARFLWLAPTLAVITNIEHDHPDIYPTLDEVKDAFSQFTENIIPQGLLIACGDDHGVLEVLRQFEGESITYGFSPANDYQIKHVSTSNAQTFFRLESGGMDLGEFAISVAGEHNVLNAVAAILVCLQTGSPIDSIRKILHRFVGSQRRFEFVGKIESGALLYDDYAHHPTELKTTLRAARMRFPGKKIVAIFQPHTYSRTKELFSGFLTAFSDADQIILTDIYASLRERPDSTVSSAALAMKLREKRSNVVHLPTLDQVVEYLSGQHFDEDTVLITLGAGDIYTIKDALALKKDG